LSFITPAPRINSWPIGCNIDAQPMEILFDPANPPRLQGEELKNTGNPIDNNSPRPAARPKQDGNKPHAEGEDTR
jgi:hypothetical protein